MVTCHLLFLLLSQQTQLQQLFLAQLLRLEQLVAQPLQLRLQLTLNLRDVINCVYARQETSTMETTTGWTLTKQSTCLTAICTNKQCGLDKRRFDRFR